MATNENPVWTSGMRPVHCPEDGPTVFVREGHETWVIWKNDDVPVFIHIG